MQVKYKKINKKEFFIQELMLISIMHIHYFTLDYLHQHMQNIASFYILLFILSFFFGLSIKEILDKTYAIKLTKQGEDFLNNDN